MKEKLIKLVTFVVLFTVLIQTVDGINFTNEAFYFPDKKPKSKGICALEENVGTNTHLLLFDKCGKYEKCLPNVNGVYTCTKNPKIRYNGEACFYKEDCYSGKCENEECAPIKGEEEATDDNQCELEYREYGGKCTKIAYEGESCENRPCAIGTECNVDNKCTKWASLDNGASCTKNELCKSGICADDICREISQDGTCNDVGKIQIPDTNGNTFDVECSSVTNKDGSKKYVPNYSMLTTKLWKEYTKDVNFKKFKIKNYNKDEKCKKEPIGSFGKYSRLQKYFKQNYAEQLNALGIIDNKGKIKKKKEFNWVVKHTLSSGYINYSTYFLLLFLILL